MEKLVLRASSGNKYFNYELAPQPSGKTLLEKLLTTDLPTFKVTDNTRTQLMSFIGIMALKGVEHSLYACTFPLSLDPTARSWFYNLDAKQTSTWSDFVKAFLTQYGDNIELTTTLRDLELLKKGEEEGFIDFFSRWRSKVALIQQRPPDHEFVPKFIDNMSPPYNCHLQYLGLDTFQKVYTVGTLIERDLINETMNHIDGLDF